MKERMMIMKRSLRWSVIILCAGFVVLFSLRLIYGYLAYPVSETLREQVAGMQSGNFHFEGKNYASKSSISKKGGGGTAAPLSVDQKYEKVGTVTTKSADYEDEEARIRAQIKEVEGLIQFEQNSGLVGRRSLHLAIGVFPEKFDSLITKLKSFGELVSIRIDKVDKTIEYKMLQAKRASLEATKNSLLELKKPGTGSLDELIKLEGIISETEAQIQDLGVNLGDYDAENEFCTVKFSLLEVTHEKVAGIAFSKRLKVAFEWTVIQYRRVVFTAIFGTLAIWGAITGVMLVQKRWPHLIDYLKS